MSSSGFWKVVYLFRVAFSAGLSGFIYGYYIGVINISSLTYTNWNEFHKSFSKQEPSETAWAYCNASGATLVICSIGTQMIYHRFNPDSAMMEPRNYATWPCLFFIVGALLIVTFPETMGVVCGLVLIGCGTGFIFLGSTIYLAEISPTRIRGAMVATFFLQIAAGQVVYYIISLTVLYFDYHDDDGNGKKYFEKWHWMPGTIPVLVLMLILWNWLPESPNCLYALGKKEEAIEILRKTRPCVEDVDREVEAFELAVKNIGHDNSQPPSKNTCVNLYAGIACLVAENLVGIDMIMYYTPRIVVHVLQLDHRYSYSSSGKYLILVILLIKSILLAIGTLLCIAFVDRYGRRRLLLFSTFGIITCLGFLSFLCYGHSMVAVTSDSWWTTGNGGRGELGLLALGALGLYYIFYSIGIGTIPWIINTELYPLEFRISFGITGSYIYWFSKTIAGALFYPCLDKFISQYTIGNSFVIQCLLSCLACYIIHVYALETTIEEVEKLLLMEKMMKDGEIDIVTNRE